jgi:RNA polymerase sigma-70 factor (ECF subfamily)
MDGVQTMTERDSIEEVYRRLGRRLWLAVLAYSSDPDVASDAVAEAFAQALRAADSIRSPTDWVWRVAFRVAAGELKRRRRFSAAVEGSYEMPEAAREVITALGKLSDRQRSAAVLHYYGGYSMKEVASMIGSSSATVAVHLHRARNRLRQLLEDGDD